MKELLRQNVDAIFVSADAQHYSSINKIRELVVHAYYMGALDGAVDSEFLNDASEFYSKSLVEREY